MWRDVLLRLTYIVALITYGDKRHVDFIRYTHGGMAILKKIASPLSDRVFGQMELTEWIQNG